MSSTSERLQFPTATLLSKNEKEEQWMQQLMETITQWWTKIEETDLSKNVILIVGPTGSGKTTFANIMEGKLETLEARLHKSKRIMIMDSNNLIGEPSPTSKTSVPTFYYLKEKNKIFVFVDCPGFGDNRGPIVDIVAMTLVKKVTEKCTSIKFLFVVPYNAVNLDYERTQFPSLLDHAVKLIGENLRSVENSIGFIVNKVPNYYPDSTVKINDEDVKAEIQDYLTEYKNASASTDLPNFEPEKEATCKKEFIELFLNSLPSKLCLLRYPKEVRKLSEDDYFRDVRLNILQFCEEQLKGTEGKSFGYAFSPASLLEIKVKLVPFLAKKTETCITDITKDLESHFIPVDYIETEDENSDQFLKTKVQLGNLKALAEALKPNNGNKPSMVLRLLADAVQLQINSTKMSKLETREGQLHYFLELSEGKFDAELYKHLKALQEALLKKLQRSVMKPIFDQIKLHISKTVGKKAMSAFIENHLQNSYDEVSFNSIIELLRATSCSVENCLLSKKPLVEDTVEDVLRIMKYHPTAINIEVDKLRKFIKRWNDFKIVWQPTEQATSEEEWLQPIKKTIRELDKLTMFYEFLEPLKIKILEYEFYQVLVNLSHQFWKDDQNIFSTLENIGIFSNVAPEIKDLYLEESHCKTVLKQVLTMSQPTISATSSGTTYVKGRCIKLSSIVDGEGKLYRTLQHHQKRLTTLLIFASEKIFLDASIKYIGEPLTVIFVAPQFEVIETGKEIILEGNNAPNHEPDHADDGRKMSGSGFNGLPGLPGGNGGTFLGLFNSIINGSALTIKSKGGNGGKGQDGGNGQPGDRGTHASKLELMPAKVFARRNEERPLLAAGETDRDRDMCIIHGVEGQPGGNGGHGGSGGYPGNPGIIQIFCADGASNTHVIEVRESGSEGPSGKGGKGAKGGENGYSSKFKLLSWCCGCCYSWGSATQFRESEFASNGSNGDDGGYTFQKQAPDNVIPKATWFHYVKNEYDQFLSECPSLSGRQLVEAFKMQLSLSVSVNLLDL